MALQYGYNITASDMRKLLEKNDKQQSGIRSWRQLFGNASLGYNAQSGALASGYADAIAQAYNANLARENAIMGAGLNLGATKEMISANRNDLHAAYNTYVQNYRNAEASIAQDYTTEVNTIDTALTERAENFAKLYNSAYQYLTEELYGLTDAEGNSYLTANKLDWLTGNETTENTDLPMPIQAAAQALGVFPPGTNESAEVLSWEQLSHQLFNNDASLTEKGRQFFEAIFNARPEGYSNAEGNAARNFDKWLSDKGTEDESYANLREWWTSQDEFNYTFGGTNAGTAKQMMGFESTDDDYLAADYIKFNSTQSNNTYASKMRQTTEKLRNSFDAYKKNLEAAEAAQNDTEAQESYYGYANAVKKAKETLDNAVNGYITQYKQTIGELERSFKQSAGTDLYNEFRKTYGTELDAEYNKLISSAFDTLSAGDYHAFDAYWQKLLRLFNDFLKSKKSTRTKASGF